MQNRGRRRRLASTGAALVASLLATAPTHPVAAQVSSRRLGQDGVTWESEASQQLGVVPVGESLQPLQILPERNLTQLLAEFGQTWQVGQAADFRFGGLPRVWTNSNAFNRLKPPKGPLLLVDGNYDTSTDDSFKSSGNPAGSAFFLDLGAPFPVNRISFRTPPGDSLSYLRAYEVSVSSGNDFDSSRQPNYTRLVRVEKNVDVVVDSIESATTLVRFIQVKNLSKTPFNMAEIEVFGDGFVPESSYLTGYHDFQGPVNFGRLTVEATRLATDDEVADEPPVCVLRMRSGTDQSPLSYFSRDRETGIETEVSEAEYATLPRAAFFRRDPVSGQNTEEVGSRDEYLALATEERGDSREFVPGAVRTDVENWSPWSAPITLDSTGATVLGVDLPAPRPFLQIQATFTGDDANAMRLDVFDMEFSPLLAASAVGEVALAREPAPAGGTPTVVAGVVDTFTYDIVVNDPVAPGFSGLKLSAFPAPEFESLTFGDAPQPVATTPEVTDDGFVVRFDPITAGETSMRVVFRQAVLEHSTPIRAWLVRDETVLEQPVAAGNANDLVTTNQIIVYSANPEPGLKVELSSPVVTPNGDQVNDDIRIDYSLIQFAADVDVHVEIFDLAGRRVRELVATKAAAGDFSTRWNGRYEDDSPVPPGMYVCQFRVEATARDFTMIRLLGVAY